MTANINQPAFKPEPAATVNIAASSVTANVQVRGAHGTTRHVRVANTAAVWVFIEFGETSGVTAATATSLPVAPGAVEIFSSPFQYVAAITASGSGTVYFTPGEGI